MLPVLAPHVAFNSPVACKLAGFVHDRHATVYSLIPRPCLHSSAPFDCNDEVEEARIVSDAFIVARGDAAEVFDLAEEAFDQVAIFVDCGSCSIWVISLRSPPTKILGHYTPAA